MAKRSRNRIENMIKCKCPKCHTGYMFEEKNAYKLKKLFKLNESCEACNQAFSPEPRFYDGAMYVSYGFSVAIVITMFVSFNILFEDPNLNLIMGVTITIAVLLSPISFRLSRSVWIHFFFHFDDTIAEKNNA